MNKKINNYGSSFKETIWSIIIFVILAIVYIIISSVPMLVNIYDIINYQTIKITNKEYISEHETYSLLKKYYNEEVRKIKELDYKKNKNLKVPIYIDRLVKYEVSMANNDFKKAEECKEIINDIEEDEEFKKIITKIKNNWNNQ